MGERLLIEGVLIETASPSLQQEVLHLKVDLVVITHLLERIQSRQYVVGQHSSPEVDHGRAHRPQRDLRRWSCLRYEGQICEVHSPKDTLARTIKEKNRKECGEGSRERKKGEGGESYR